MKGAFVFGAGPGRCCTASGHCRVGICGRGGDPRSYTFIPLLTVEVVTPKIFRGANNGHQRDS
jgi:hypothetical protein